MYIEAVTNSLSERLLVHVSNHNNNNIIIIIKTHTRSFAISEITVVYTTRTMNLKEARKSLKMWLESKGKGGRTDYRMND